MFQICKFYVKKNALLFSIDPKLYRARVEKAKAQLNKSQALKQKAERDLQRIRPLYEQNAASQLDLDNAVAAFEAAQAEIALSYTEVRSPISGFISESSADIGTLVGPGGKSLLATVVSSDTVQVNFSMTGLDYLKSKERNVNLGIPFLFFSPQCDAFLLIACATIRGKGEDTYVLENERRYKKRKKRIKKRTKLEKKSWQVIS